MHVYSHKISAVSVGADGFVRGNIHDSDSVPGGIYPVAVRVAPGQYLARSFEAQHIASDCYGHCLVSLCGVSRWTTLGTCKNRMPNAMHLASRFRGVRCNASRTRTFPGRWCGTELPFRLLRPIRTTPGPYPVRLDRSRM